MTGGIEVEYYFSTPTPDFLAKDEKEGCRILLFSLRSSGLKYYGGYVQEMNECFGSIICQWTISALSTYPFPD